MPLASFKRIQEVSSEDRKHTAQNLLQGDATLKWKTRLVGEPQAYVVLELQQPEKIVGIDIGNEHSAYIGVTVGRSSATSSDFKDLLITSSFMTPTESKNSSNPNRVICFNADAMVPATVAENWSLVKITCTQPFNKHVQYGLSFVKLRVAADPEGKHENPKASSVKAIVQSPPKLLLKLRDISPDSESDSAGCSGLFKRWKTNSRSTNDSPNTSKPKQLPPILSIKETSNNLLKKRNSLDASCMVALPKIPKEPIKDVTIESKSSEMEVKTSNTPATNATTSDSVRSVKKTPPVIKCMSPPRPTNRKYRAFGSLLDGVVLVISGIQNPDRADLRNKALALGAKYKANWDHSCSHLICAFKNTPKYNEVLGKGKIVKRTWIEECFNQRKYLPWRRYALVSAEASKPESDEEIWEEAPQSSESPMSHADMSDDEAEPTEEGPSKSGLESEAIFATEDCTDKIRKRNVYEESTDEEDYLPKKCSRKT